VSDLRPDVVARLQQMTGGLMARGLDPLSAKHTALRAMAGAVSRQGAVLAFEKTFLLQGVAFVVVLPLLFFLRVGKTSKAEHVEMSVE
jgi:DHA2 family multidrug resistance protein